MRDAIASVRELESEVRRNVDNIWVPPATPPPAVTPGAAQEAAITKTGNRSGVTAGSGADSLARIGLYRGGPSEQSSRIILERQLRIQEVMSKQLVDLHHLRYLQQLAAEIRAVQNDYGD